jgi:hypothetical protein
VSESSERSRELTAFPDFRNPLDLIIAEGDIAVSYGRIVGVHDTMAHSEQLGLLG